MKEDADITTSTLNVPGVGSNTSSNACGILMDGEHLHLFTNWILCGVESALLSKQRQESSSKQEKKQEVALQDVWRKANKASKMTPPKQNMPASNKFQGIN